MARKKKKKRPSYKPPPLTVEMVLAWADFHFQRTGKWPNKQSGKILGTIEEKWGNVHIYLGTGGRGLPGGTTLAKLLQKERGVFNVRNQPNLTHKQIVAWADAHFERVGSWPIQVKFPNRQKRAGPLSMLP